MAASRNDSSILGNDTLFRARVQAALLKACMDIKSEGAAIASHRERVVLIHQILNTPGSVQDAATKFAWSVAVDPNVIAGATTGGTVALTAGNVDAAQLNATDAMIDTAIASQFNAYCSGILE